MQTIILLLAAPQTFLVLKAVSKAFELPKKFIHQYLPEKYF